jgi:hypothetical protein
MARSIREPAHPSKRIPGSAPPMRPIRSAGPKAEPAYRTTPGASVNKRSVPREPAFKTTPGAGSDV